jgi:exodeoxyribonuclease VII large subunit
MRAAVRQYQDRIFHLADKRVSEAKAHHKTIEALRALLRGPLERDRARLRLAAGRLDALSPLSVLARGYSIVFDQNGGVLKSARAVNTGDSVLIRLHDGALDAQVTGRRSN